MMVVTIDIGVVRSIKSEKVKPVTEEIIIFGGPPIKVAVPPILEVNISPTMNGLGSIFSNSDISIVMATIKRIVVTLSKKADNIAVINRNKMKS